MVTVPRPLALLLVLAVACTASAREKTIRTTYSAVDTGCTALGALDIVGLVDAAPDRARAQKIVANYKAATVACSIAFKAVQAATQVNDDASLSGMVSAALTLSGILHDLGVL